MSIVIILGTAHTLRTPGKRSPDGTFREALYSREVAREVKAILEARGHTVFIDYEPAEPKPEWRSASPTIERNRELAYRVNYVNALCRKYGAANCIYVSMHTDAARGSGWQPARGLSVRVCQGASQSSKDLARSLYEAGASRGLAGNRSVPKEKYWVQNLYVLRNTACPAVLTETLFQNNREDVHLLLSEEGKQKVIDFHVEGIINYLNNSRL